MQGKDFLIREYERRMNLALDYVRDNLDGDLSVQQVAQAAFFSPFHFHRLFRALIGETLHEHVRRLRLEKAANALLFSPAATITDIALECGFSSSATFARAFRDHFGVSASTYRAGERRKSKANRKEGKAKSKHGKASTPAMGYSGPRQLSFQQGRCTMNVDIRTIEPMRVAYVRHLGGYTVEGIGEAYEKLMQWAGPRNLMGPGTRVVGISHDNPDITPGDKCRYDACITVDEGVEARGPVSVKDLPGGTCAVYRFRGKAEEIADAYRSLFGDWLPSSGYQPGDAPCMEFCLNDPHQDPEGKFTMDICIPVKPL